MLFEAVKALSVYIAALNIDLFAIPVYTTGLHVLLIDSEGLLKRVAEYANEGRVFPLFEMRTNEAYFRLRERYTGTVNLPLLKGIHTEVINTKGRYKRLEDIPHLRSILARDFEIVVAEAVDGQHYGDNISMIDVIDRLGRRIECKKGKGMFIKQTSPTK